MAAAGRGNGNSNKGLNRGPSFVLRGHMSQVTAVASHPNHPHLLASGDLDGELKLWDFECRRATFSHRVCVRGILGVTFPVGEVDTLYVQGRDGVVQRWALDSAAASLCRQPKPDMATGAFSFCKLAAPWRADAASATSSSSGGSNPTGSSFPHASDKNGCTGEIGKSGDDAQPGASDAGEGRAEGAAWMSRSGGASEEAVETGTVPPVLGLPSSSNGIFEVWDTRTATSVLAVGDSMSKTAGQLMALQLPVVGGSAASDCIAIAGYESGHVAAWDCRATAEPLAMARLHHDPVMCVALDRQASGGVVGSADSDLVFFGLDLAGQGGLHTAAIVTLPRRGVAGVDVRGDGAVCASAGWDHKVRVFDYKTNAQMCVLRHHSEQATNVVFTRCGSFLCSSGQEGSIAMWQVS